MSLLYAVLGKEWNGKFIRRPNMIIIMDDYGASRAYKDESSMLYTMMIGSRHKSVICMMFALHEFMNMHK